jgi:hypothetical protein
VGVNPLGGRVTNYTMNLTPRSLTDAETLMAHEFPPDTNILWTNKLAGCTQVEYASATLHTILGNADVGDVQAEFSGTGSTVAQAFLSNLPGAVPDPSATC